MYNDKLIKSCVLYKNSLKFTSTTLSLTLKAFKTYYKFTKVIFINNEI